MPALGVGVYSWKLKMVYWTLQTIEQELRSMEPKLVPLLATRCLYLGHWVHRGWWGGGTSDKTSAWPTGWWHVMLTCSSTTLGCEIPVLGWNIKGANRGYRGIKGHWGIRGIGGYIWKMKMVYCKVLLKTQDGLLQAIEHELRWMGPKLVPLLATSCLYWGYIWAQIKLTWCCTALGH